MPLIQLRRDSLSNWDLEFQVCVTHSSPELPCWTCILNGDCELASGVDENPSSGQFEILNVSGIEMLLLPGPMRDRQYRIDPDSFWNEPRRMWLSVGPYEYEFEEKRGATGWYRCTNGRLADGRWPEYNSQTGGQRGF